MAEDCAEFEVLPEQPLKPADGNEPLTIKETPPPIIEVPGEEFVIHVPRG